MPVNAQLVDRCATRPLRAGLAFCVNRLTRGDHDWLGASAAFSAKEGGCVNFRAIFSILLGVAKDLLEIGAQMG
jgi:hypothetical protein